LTANLALSLEELKMHVRALRPQQIQRGMRYRYRLVAAMLVVSLPLLVVLAVMLTTSASASLSQASQSKGEGLARAVSLRMEDWLSERRADMSILAAQASGQLTDPATAARLARADKAFGSYTLIELTDLQGRVLSSSRAGVTLEATGATPTSAHHPKARVSRWSAEPSTLGTSCSWSPTPRHSQDCCERSTCDDRRRLPPDPGGGASLP
jgi:hypothetical protein